MKRTETVFLAAFALAAAASAAGAADAGTHLFEARVPDGRTVVFLPAADVESPDDAAAWLRWAGESLPGGRKRLRAVWDEDVVELDLFGRASGLLHAGDDAVDSGGRVRFVLAETPAPDAETVRVRLAAVPGRDTATPDTACLTNVWILSRERFFARCRDEADAGRTADARKAIADLFAAGPVHSGTPGWAGWSEALDAFCRDVRGVEASVRFLNRGNDLLRVRVPGGDVLDIPPGGEDGFRPAPDAKFVEWEAWSETVRADEDDYEPEKDRRPWSRFGDDVSVAFEGTVGRLKPPPRLHLPAGTVPAALHGGKGGLEADVVYAGGSGVAAVAETSADGAASVEIEPRRPVQGVRLKASGWLPAEFRLDAPRALARGETVPLAGPPMRRDVKPWPESVRVEIGWNGFDGAASLRAERFPGVPEQRLDPAKTSYALRVADALAREPDEASERTFVLAALFGLEGDSIRTNVVVRRGEKPAVVRFEFPRPAPRPVVKRDVPKWPGPTRINAAKAWLSSRNPNAPGLLLLAESDDKDVRDRAVTYLRALQGFWPVPQLENDHVRTLRDLTTHIALCDGCGSHADAADPKTEAFRVLGWDPDAQRRFRRETLDVAPRFQWPWNMDSVQSLFVGRLRKYCASGVSRTTSSWEGDLDKAFDMWNGIEPGKRPDETAFQRAYRHVEICPGCDKCRSFRLDVLSAPDFESRREALFRALVGRSLDPLSETQIKDVFREFKRLAERKQAGGSGK